MKTFIIFDTNNLIWRAKHKLKGSKVTDQEFISETVGVLFSFIRRGYEKFKANHCVMCFDSYSWRKSIYPEYKSNRDKQQKTEQDHNEYQLMVDILNELNVFLTEKTNISVLSCPGIEADDFIAVWCQTHDDKEIYKNIIISADSDFKQLVQNNIELFDPISNTLYSNGKIYYQDGKKINKNDMIQYIYNDIWKVKTKKQIINDIEVQVPEQFDPKWHLVLKLIRGDAGDYIKPAFPRVREERIKRAYADYGGIEWNNLINDSFKIGDDIKSVRELYERNKKLIDLTCQPKDIKDKINEVLCSVMTKKKTMMVQLYFIQFCGKMKLKTLSNQIEAISSILAASYI